MFNNHNTGNTKHDLPFVFVKQLLSKHKKYQEKKISHRKTFTLQYKAWKNITRFFDCKIVMELCNKIREPSLIKIIRKKRLFFKIQLGLKHDKIVLKIAKKN